MSVKRKFLKIYDYYSKKDYSTIVLTSGGEKLQFNTKYFFEYLLKLKKYEILYIINDKKKRKELKSKYGDYFIGSKSFMDRIKILKSEIWLTDTVPPISGLNESNKRVFINLWHGIPLKTVGALQNKVNKKSSESYKKNASKYSAFLSPSSKLEELYEKSFLLKKSQIKILGQCRNSNINEKVNLNFYFKELPMYKKAILYVPTWRDKETIFFPFKDFKPKELMDFLEKNKFIIFIKGHQYEKGLKDLKLGERVVIIKDEIDDITELLNGFDLLMTDYSSVYFDYLLLNKPLLFLPYDLEEYIEERGLNFKYSDVTQDLK